MKRGGGRRKEEKERGRGGEREGRKGGRSKERRKKKKGRKGWREGGRERKEGRKEERKKEEESKKKAKREGGKEERKIRIYCYTAGDIGRKSLVRISNVFQELKLKLHIVRGEGWMRTTQRSD